MTGDRRPDQIARPLDRLERKGIEVIRGEVERIDPARREAQAGFGAGDFYAEPHPVVRMRRPGWLWHAGKVLFEKQVMWQWL
jgi:hypothetical protein